MTNPTLSAQSDEKTRKLPRARARFLAQAIQLEEEGFASIISTTIYFSLFLFIAIVIWASVTTVNEVTIAKGEAVPAGYIHDIQHLEGGIVSEIAVRNGDQVKPGDLLIRFALPVSQADYEQLQVRKATLSLSLERLLAIEENRQPDFGETGKNYPGLAAKNQSSYSAQIASVDSELEVLKAQANQKESELRRQKNQVNSVKKEISLLQTQVNMREKLASKHIVSQTDLLATKSQLASTQSQLRSVQDGIGVAIMALQEAKKRRLEILAGHKKEVEFEASEIAGQLAEVEKSLVKAEDKVNRLNLFAPISGIIQGISVTSINAVVKPGDVILQIVPVNDDLIVEARILPEDVGHVHIDQPTEVKVDSYDSGKFGHVDGRVTQISASTYLDEERKPYYRANIGLDKAFLGDNPDQMKIIPGMTVQVNILTGAKTILEYLLKPINRGFHNAFQER